VSTSRGRVQLFMLTPPRFPFGVVNFFGLAPARGTFWHNFQQFLDKISPKCRIFLARAFSARITLAYRLARGARKKKLISESVILAHFHFLRLFCRVHAPYMSILRQFSDKFDTFCYNVYNVTTSLARTFGAHICLGFVTLRYESDEECALKRTYNRKETVHIIMYCIYV